MNTSMQTARKGRPPRKDNPQRFTLRLSGAAKKKANRIASRNGVAAGTVIEHLILNASDHLRLGVLTPETAQ